MVHLMTWGELAAADEIVWGGAVRDKATVIERTDTEVRIQWQSDIGENAGRWFTEWIRPDMDHPVNVVPA